MIDVDAVKRHIAQLESDSVIGYRRFCGIQPGDLVKLNFEVIGAAPDAAPMGWNYMYGGFLAMDGQPLMVTGISLFDGRDPHSRFEICLLKDGIVATFVDNMSYFYFDLVQAL